MSDLVEVFRSKSTPEIQLMRAALIDHGIHATLAGEHLAGMLGGGAWFIQARIMVPAEQEAEARAAVELIKAMAAEPVADRSDPSTCPACGVPWEPGFDACWSCEAELPG